MLLHKKITSNKALELQLSHFQGSSWFHFSVEYTSGRDHAGFYCRCEILGYCFSMSFHDTRHWDYKNKQWEQGG